MHPHKNRLKEEESEKFCNELKDIIVNVNDTSHEMVTGDLNASMKNIPIFIDHVMGVPMSSERLHIKMN